MPSLTLRVLGLNRSRCMTLLISLPSLLTSLKTILPSAIIWTTIWHQRKFQNRLFPNCQRKFKICRQTKLTNCTSMRSLTCVNTCQPLRRLKKKQPAFTKLWMAPLSYRLSTLRIRTWRHMKSRLSVSAWRRCLGWTLGLTGSDLIRTVTLWRQSLDKFPTKSQGCQLTNYRHIWQMAMLGMTGSAPVTLKRHMKMFWRVPRVKRRLKSGITTRLFNLFPSSRGNKAPIWIWRSIRIIRRKSKSLWVTPSVQFDLLVRAACQTVLTRLRWIQIRVVSLPWRVSIRMFRHIRLKMMHLALSTAHLLLGQRLRVPRC